MNAFLNNATSNQARGSPAETLAGGAGATPPAIPPITNTAPPQRGRHGWNVQILNFDSQSPAQIEPGAFFQAINSYDRPMDSDAHGLIPDYAMTQGLIDEIMTNGKANITIKFVRPNGTKLFCCIATLEPDATGMMRVIYVTVPPLPPLAPVPPAVPAPAPVRASRLHSFLDALFTTVEHAKVGITIAAILFALAYFVIKRVTGQ